MNLQARDPPTEFENSFLMRHLQGVLCFGGHALSYVELPDHVRDRATSPVLRRQPVLTVCQTLLQSFVCMNSLSAHHPLSCSYCSHFTDEKTEV